MIAAPGAEVEAATWVPLRTERVGPWLAGLSGGFTRRGNSARLVGHGDPVAALAEVEAWYRDQGEPTICRVPTERAAEPAPEALRRALDARGYRTVSTTRVLARELSGAAPEPTIDAAERPDDAWLDAWLGDKAPAGSVVPDLARRLVTGSFARYLTARGADGGVAGVIRAARVEDWVALSCLVVAADARRQGLGGRLTSAALAATDAADRPAGRAFLQVEIRNGAALELYRRLGFVEVDEYTYRVLG